MAQFDPVTGVATKNQWWAPDQAGSGVAGMGGRYLIDNFAPAPINVPMPRAPLGSVPNLPQYASQTINPPATPPGTVPPPAPTMPAGYTQQEIQQLIQSDPFVIQQNADIAAEGVQDLASRDAATQRAIGLFGEVPDFGGAVNQGMLGAINDTVRGIAAQNTKAGTSTIARIKEMYQDSIEGIKNSLAARGMLQSGETGYQFGRADTANTRAQFDARNQLVDHLNSVNQGWVQSERARQMARLQALMAAAGRIPPKWPNPYPPGTDDPNKPTTTTTTLPQGETPPWYVPYDDRAGVQNPYGPYWWS